MPQLFCCSNLHQLAITSAKNQTLREFTKWATTTTPTNSTTLPPLTVSSKQPTPTYTQFSMQLNGSKEYEYNRSFTAKDSSSFEETFQARPDGSKRVAYERLQCKQHERIFEISVYQFRPETGSRFRANIAKALSRIEDALRSKKGGVEAQGQGRGRVPVRSGSEFRSGSIPGHRTSSTYRPRTGNRMRNGSEIGSRVEWVDCWDGRLDSESDDTGFEEYYYSEDLEQAGSSLPSLDVDSGQDYFRGEDETASRLTLQGEEVAVRDDSIDQCYLDVEEYGYYFSWLASDDYGSYCCDTVDGDMAFD